MSAILRGLHRALPYIVSSKGRAGSEFLEDQLDTFYKMCHLVKFKVSVQVLQLLYQVMVSVQTEGPLTERYHRVLYSQILSPELSRSTSKDAFLNLVFKTMNRMASLDTLKAFTLRLLQVAILQSTDVVVGILYMISELCVDNPLMRHIIDNTEPIVEVKEGAKKGDSDDVSTDSPAELEVVVDPLTQQKTEGDSDDEYFADLDVGPDGKPIVAEKNINSSSVSKELGVDGSCETKPSWLHRTVQYNKSEVKTRYNPYNRNPTYCGVHNTKLWPLSYFLHHNHPTVAIFAQKILYHESLNYKGDPLIDFTLMKFLDRFTHKNPKQVITKSNDGSECFGDKSLYVPSLKRSMDAFSDQFKNLKSSKVPEDAKFIHKYLNMYTTKKSKIVKKATEEAKDEFEDDDEDDVEHFLESLTNKFKDDDEFDDEWDNEAEDKLAKKKQSKEANDMSSDSEGDNSGRGGFDDDDDDDDDNNDDDDDNNNDDDNDDDDHDNDDHDNDDHGNDDHDTDGDSNDDHDTDGDSNDETAMELDSDEFEDGEEFDSDDFSGESSHSCSITLRAFHWHIIVTF